MSPYRDEVCVMVFIGEVDVYCESQELRPWMVEKMKQVADVENLQINEESVWIKFTGFPKYPASKNASQRFIEILVNDRWEFLESSEIKDAQWFKRAK